MNSATDNMHMNLAPRVSEKSYDLNKEGVYVFEVPTSVSKQLIAKAVETQFKVTVSKVRTTTLKGKKISSSRRRKRPIAGYRADVKKAYVTLVKGDKLTIFEETE